MKQQQQSERSPLLPPQPKGHEHAAAPPASPHLHSLTDEKRSADASDPLPGEPQSNFLGGSQTIRHRKKSRSQRSLHRANEDNYNDGHGDDSGGDSGDNDSDDGADSTDLEEMNHSDHFVDENDNEHAKRVAADRKFQREKAAAGSASDGTAALLPMGLAKRKPRWSGLRNKLAAISSTKSGSGQDVLPRINGRRTRHRPSNLRDDDGYGDYYEAVAMDRTLRAPPTDAPKARIAAYCTCDQIALFKLLKWLDKTVKETAAGEEISRLCMAGWKNKMYMGVIHSTLSGRANDEDDLDASHKRHLLQKDAFYFATGCCVFWGLTREEEALHLQALVPFSTGPVAQIEAEDMLFSYGEASRVANDEILLSSDAVAEKLAISFAMSQSAKLDVFEERVEDRIKNTKHIPSNLATTGSIQYTKKDISKLIGQLFIELADVNLHSDILDEPDFFWEDDEYEPLYKRMVKYLDVTNRVKILNKRLDILRELVEVLNQELTRQHGTKLEWIIIWLLVAEIVLAVGWNIIVKDLLGFFKH